MSTARDLPACTIVDDFLDEESWTAVWTHFQFAELHPVSRGAGAWKLSDGVPLGGEETLLARDRDPDPEAPLAPLLAALQGAASLIERRVPDGWQRLSARPYVYPADTALSWHVDDHELYAGAFIYYAHPRWDAHWGGELLLAERPPDAEELPIMAYRFETEGYSEELLEPGHGAFVLPRPNRLVLLGGAPHCVTRVSPAAGQAVRASVSGFFLR